MAEIDYYGVLGVEQAAVPTEIRAAYRRLALQYHPDRNKDNPAATEKMMEVNEAYAILSDPAKRQEYDELRKEDEQFASARYRQTHTAEDIFRGSDINQVYDELAREFGLRGFDKVFRKTYGQRYQLFEFQNQSVFGRALIFYGTRNDIAAGSKSGLKNKAPTGSLDIDGLVQNIFDGKRNTGKRQKKGKDRKQTIILSAKLINGGGEAEISFKQSTKKRKLVIQIPAGIREGQNIRLRGQGEPGQGGGQPGDLLLEVRSSMSRWKRFLSVFRR